MDTPRTRRCPGCGRLVVLPQEGRTASDVLDDRRLDQLAQSLCGCWVTDLSHADIRDLLEAIASSNGHGPGHGSSHASRAVAETER